MSIDPVDQAVEKIETLGKIVRQEAHRVGSMTEKEMSAVQEAIQTQYLSQDKLKEEQKKKQKKEHKHRL